MAGPADADWDEARRACTRFLNGFGDRSMAATLRRLADYAGERERDFYGSGGVVAELESRIAALLGTEAAVFVPSGTMAQQAALRVWAEATGVDTVAVHALSHLEVHELRAVWELHPLRPLTLTREPRPATVDDLTTIADRLGTVTVELPLRDAAYALPSWDELVTFCGAAREREAVLHADGARLWETVPHFGHPLADIAGLFDSVYVSFYKVLGGTTGAALAGPEQFVAACRRWRKRLGGELATSYPAALGALYGLEHVLPQVPRCVAHAADVAAALAAVPGVRVTPAQVNSFRLYLDADATALESAALARTVATRELTFRWFNPADVPGWAWTEVTIDPHALDWTAEEVATVVGDLLSRL